MTMKIKTLLYSLMYVMAALTLLSSCLEKDDEVATDEYCYISSFSLGNMKRAIHTTDREGKDSVYYVVISGSKYPMSIDQRSLTIENKDSLPYGTKVDAVLATANFKGLLVYKYADDTQWSQYSNKDSIDFSRKVEFSAVSTSGNSERRYTVKVNVHQQDGSVFAWQSLGTDEALASLRERKVVVCGTQLVLLGKTAEGTVQCAQRALASEGAWTVTATSGASLAEVSTLQVWGKQLLMSTTQGALLQSHDGRTWTVLNDVQDGRRLAGVSGDCIYTVDATGMQASYDGGVTWQQEALDDKVSKLPTQQLSLLTCVADNGYTQLILMGQATDPNDGKAAVWAKSWRNEAQARSAMWMYYAPSSDNLVRCPQLTPLYVVNYDKGLMALGGPSQDGQYAALSTLLYSPDYGLTWRKTSELITPASVHGTTEPFTLTVDADQHLWMVVGTETWRGRLNRLGFVQAD